MTSSIESQQDAEQHPSRSLSLLPFTMILSGSLLTLISFLFLNWNPPFTPYSHTANPFLNGPGVFGDMVHYYSLAASIWLWMIPLAAFAALILACGALFWRLLYLHSLITIPSLTGSFLLAQFALTGQPWDYANYGYWLALLGLLVMLGAGLRSGAMLSQKQRGSDYSLVLTYCRLMGSILIMISFFLPWLALRSERSTYVFQYDLYHYKGVPTSGAELASGFFPYIQQFYRQMTPEVLWLLWLVPVAGLIGVIIASMDLSGYRVPYWLRLLVVLVPLALFLFPLRTLTTSNVALYGLHTTLIGLALLMSSLFWSRAVQEERTISQEKRRNTLLRRSILGGIFGLLSVGYIGYIAWRTTAMHNALVVVPFASDESEIRGKSVAWAPDGIRLAIVSYTTIQIWDALEQKRLISIPLKSSDASDYSNALAWSPDQRFIAIVSNSIAQIFTVATGQLLSSWAVYSAYVQGISWSSDSRRLATPGGRSGNSIEIHDRTTGKLLQSLGEKGSMETYTGVSWSPDERYLATTGFGAGDNNNQTFLRIWEAFTGKQLSGIYYSRQRTGSRLPNVVAWSPDGHSLATISDTIGVGVWKKFGEEPSLAYVGTGGPFSCLAWSPDSRYIASGDDNVVRVWNSATGETIFSYLGHQDIIQSISWSPRNNSIASLSSNELRIWQPEIR